MERLMWNPKFQKEQAEITKYSWKIDTIRKNEPNVTNRKWKYASIYIYKDKWLDILIKKK